MYQDNSNNPESLEYITSQKKQEAAEATGTEQAANLWKKSMKGVDSFDEKKARAAKESWRPPLDDDRQCDTAENVFFAGFAVPELENNNPDEVAETAAEQRRDAPKSHEEELLEDIKETNILTQTILEKAGSLISTRANAAQEVFTSLINQSGVSTESIASAADRLIQKIPSTVTNIGDIDGANDPAVKNKNEAASQLATILSYAQTISGIAKLRQGDLDGAEERASEAAKTAESSITDKKLNPDNDTQNNKDASYIAGSALESANALQKNIDQIRSIQAENESANEIAEKYAADNNGNSYSTFYATPDTPNYKPEYNPYFMGPSPEPLAAEPQSSPLLFFTAPEADATTQNDAIGSNFAELINDSLDSSLHNNDSSEQTQAEQDTHKEKGTLTDSIFDITPGEAKAVKGALAGLIPPSNENVQSTPNSDKLVTKALEDIIPGEADKMDNTITGSLMDAAGIKAPKTDPDREGKELTNSIMDLTSHEK